MVNPFRAGTLRLKQFVMRWGQTAYGRLSDLLSRTRYDYIGEAGDGRTNTIVQACIGWVQRNFPDAPIQLAKVISDEESEIVRNHPMLLRIRHPNKFYAGGALWSATLWDYMLDGNAYWLKVRSGAGKVVELWYAPHWTMEPQHPREDQTVFISHYEYSPGDGKVDRIDVKDVVHFRNGIDPQNPRKGLSRLKALARELITDDEAANFVATMMRNGPVPSTIIMPRGQNKMTPDGARLIKDEMMTKFTGDGRGEPMILRGEVEIVPMSFKPNEVNAREIRRLPEERVSAVLGVPAVVAGLGTGLDHQTYNNYGEAKAEGYEGTIIPMHRVFGEELHLQLLPDFEANTDLWMVGWDYTKVRALMEDADAVATRATKLAGGPIALINEARSMVSLPPFEQGNFLYVPASVAPVSEEDLFAPPEPVQIPSRVIDQPAAEDDAALWYADEDETIDWPAAVRLKAGGTGVHAAILRYREAEVPRTMRAMARTFVRLRDETIARLLDVTKTLPQDMVLLSERSQWAERLEARLINLYDDEIRKTLTREHVRYLMGVQQVVSVAFETEIKIDDMARTAFLQTAGEQIVGISRRTLRQVRLALEEGVAAGEDADQIADRLKSLAAFGKARAQVVARTEVGQATNEASLLTYALSGIVDEIVVHDGVDHDAGCANLNGKRMTLAEARFVPRIGHPQCVRSFAPVVRKTVANVTSNGHVHEAVAA